MCCSEKQRNGQYKIKLLGVLQSYDVGDEAAVKSGCSTFEAAEPLTSVMDGRKCCPNKFPKLSSLPVSTPRRCRPQTRQRCSWSVCSLLSQL